MVVSRDGKSVETLAASRAFAPIVAAVDSARVANWLSTWWGVIPVLLEDLSRPELAARRALAVAKERSPGPFPERMLIFSERNRLK